MSYKYNVILKLILDNKIYEEYLNNLLEHMYTKFPNIKIDNIEIILDSISKIILSMGLYDKSNKNDIEIKILNNNLLKIPEKEFIDYYNKYIENVIRFRKSLFNN